MTGYAAVLKTHFIAQLQYRAAAWAGIGTQLFFGFIKVMIFTGFFQSSTLEQPMSYRQVIDYLWLGQALLLILPFRVDKELSELIRTGNVTYELSRPVDLYRYWYSRALALRLAPVFLRVVPMIIVTAGLFPLMGLGDWGLKGPATATGFLFFLLSVGAAFLLSAALSVLMSITAMWTISTAGIDQLMPSFIWIFSGIIIPLPFFPEAVQGIFRLLPFRGMLDIPFRLYNGDIGGLAVVNSLAVQGFWIAFLIIAGRFLLSRGLKRLVVQGG